MYQIIFDDEAISFLNNLPKELKERIFNKLVAAKENPFHFFERLSERDDYKLRIGDYRIIGDIHQADNKIHITTIGHRKNVYEKLK